MTIELNLNAVTHCIVGENLLTFDLQLAPIPHLRCAPLPKSARILQFDALQRDAVYSAEKYCDEYSPLQ